MIATPCGSRTSASLVLLVAGLALTACGGGSGGGSGPVTGTQTPTTPPAGAASCQPQATVDLQPGQRLSLTSAQAACFRLQPKSSARYVLAGFDGRNVESARSGPESAASDEPAYLLGDGTASVAPTAIPSSANRTAAPDAGDIVVRRTTAGDEADPFQRAAPWREGERFPVRRRDGSASTARVVRIYGGRYVFAIVDADAGSHAARFLDQTGRGMDFMVREGLGVLERVFGAAPATSAGSGQLLIVLAAWNPDEGAGLATTTAAQDGSGVSTYLWLNLEVRPGVREGFDRLDHPSYRLKVLAHELTHAWQMRYAYESQAAGARAVSFGPAWAMEGSADLVAMDLVRRSLGVGLTSNWDWQNTIRNGGDAVTYALEPYDTRGRLARGYFDASSFLRDLQLRLVRSGLSADDAMAQVGRGALEGWYGVDGAGVRRQGLAARMRTVLGSGWDPAEAVLLWTATQAADDQTSNPELNNPVYSRAADPEGSYAWKAAVDEVKVGRTFAYEVRRVAGSSFFVRVEDDGRGGTLAAASSVNAARWMIVRVK